MVVAVATCPVASIGGGSASMLRAIMSSSLQVRPVLVHLSKPDDWDASSNASEVEPTLSVRSRSEPAVQLRSAWNSSCPLLSAMISIT